MKTMNLALACAAAAWLAGAAFGEIRIEMKPAVVAPSGEVRLGQVATVTCPDATTAENVSDVGLGSAPAAGNVRNVGRDHVAMCLVRAGYDPAQLKWSGAAGCVVTVKSVRVSGDDIAKAGRDYLQSLPQLKREDVKIEAEQVPRDFLAVADQAPALEAAAASVERPWGRLRVFVKISSGGKALTTVPVVYLVTCKEKVVVAARPIGRGEIVNRAHLDLREVVLGPGCENESCVTRLEDVIGKQAARAVAVGAVLDATTVSEPLAIRRGDSVSVALRSAHMEILTKGVAQRDGFVGDVVPVKVFVTGKELSCKITSTGAVELPM